MARTPDAILDELLVLRSQTGDRAAFGELVARWQPRLWRHALRLTGRADAASDTAQDAWLAIVSGLDRLDDPAAFRAWAYHITTNKCADWARRQQRRRRLERGVAHAQAEPAPPKLPGGDAELHAAMRLLTGEQQTVLALYYAEDLSTSEIAAALGVPHGTVKSRLHHARNAIKQTLERTPHEQH